MQAGVVRSRTVGFFRLVLVLGWASRMDTQCTCNQQGKAALLVDTGQGGASGQEPWTKETRVARMGFQGSIIARNIPKNFGSSSMQLRPWVIVLPNLRCPCWSDTSRIKPH